MFRFGKLIALSLVLAWPNAVQAEEGVQAGVSAAVRGDVQLARGEGIVGLQIDSGDAIYLQDQIRSGTDSGMQILLLDETVFTIGPNSEMIIDDFVYDPDTGTGQVAASVTKGVFRFVTGKVAQNDPDQMSVKTPLGTIGIRGTIGGGIVSPERTEIVLLGPGVNNNTPERAGAITVSNDQGSVTIERTGFGTILLPEAPPSVPAASDNAFLRGLRSGATENGASRQEGNSTGGNQGQNTGGLLTGAPSATGQTQSVTLGRSIDTGAFIDGVQNNDDTSDDLDAGVGDINTIAELNGGSGQFHFNDSGSLSDGGTYNIAVDIDFSSRTIGGGNSGVEISPSGFTGGTFSILSNDFSTGTDGLAVFEGQNNINFDCGGNTCNGAVVMKFRDFSGTVGGAMEHKVSVTNTDLSLSVTGSDIDTTRGNGATVGVGGGDN